jgi:hypothetical protein
VNEIGDRPLTCSMTNPGKHAIVTESQI